VPCFARVGIVLNGVRYCASFFDAKFHARNILNWS
jgi:hypothetical protein